MAKDKEQALIEIVLKGQQANASLKDMEKAVRSLSAQLKSLPKDSQQFADKKAEFQKMSKSLKDLQNDVKGVGGVFQSIGKEIKGFGVLAAGYLGFDWLTSSISGIIKNNAQLSDSLADIRKTTGMTEAEARKLNTSFGQIDTRTAAKELRNIAIVGGQLGIAKNDIFGFTVAVDKMNVALGDEFTGGAEEVTKAMGGLRNIFTDIKTDKVDQDLLHIGNAINELASSGAATGPVVSDFANRIGGVGITLGLTSGQVLGLSATLQELNVSTERGGTAVTKILQKMTTNTAEFAKVAGIPVKEFTELVNKDLYGAFVKVVEGSKKGNVSATEFGKTLDSLGVDGAGASEVFAKLGSNTKMLGEKVSLANGALQNTDSILAEFTTKNTTLAAETERLSKGLSAAFTNSTVSEGLKGLVGLVADLFDRTKKASEAMADEQNHVNALLIEIKSSNVTNERRLEIYDELKAINPEIVDGINRENISIQELTKNVNEYNAAQINKIAVQKKQEELDEANANAADKLIEQSEAATYAYEKLGKIQQLNTISSIQYKKILDNENLTTSEKIKKIIELARVNEWASGKRNQEARLVKELATDASRLTYTEREYARATEASNAILEEKSKLEKSLIKNKKDEIDYTKLSIDQLNSYVKDSTESMGNYHRKEGRLALEELKRRELDKKNTVISIDEEKAKKLKANRDNLLEELERISYEHSLYGKSQDEREILAVVEKYKHLKEKAKGNKADLLKINQLYGEELAELMIKQADRLAENWDKESKEDQKRLEEANDFKLRTQKEINSIFLSDEEREKQAIRDKWQSKIDIAKEKGVELVGVNEAIEKEISEITEKYHKKNLDEFDIYNGTRQVKAGDYVSALQNLDAALLQTKKQNSEKELNDLDSKYSQEIYQAKHLYEQKRITKEEYDRRLASVEAKKLADQKRIKNEIAEKEKQAAVRTAIISGISGVARTLGEYAYPYNLILAALHAGVAAVQVANLENADIPQYAAGGFTQTSTNPQGFTTGATLFTNSASGTPFIAGEKGTEWIASNWMVNDPTYGPQIQMLETIQRRGFYAGGNTGKAPIFSQSTSTASNNSNKDINALASVVSQLNNTLLGLQENGVPAYINYDLMQKTLSSFDSAKVSAQSK